MRDRMQQALASSFDTTAPSPLAGRTVLQIIPSLQGGEAARVTIETAGALADVGARALVASTGGKLVSELQARGGLWIPFPADARNPLAMLRNVRTLVELIRTEQPAIVHAQARAPAWVALGATRLTRIPFMTTCYDSDFGRHAIRQHYDSVMARGDAVVASSHVIGEALVALYPWARDRIRVVWPGIDLRDFHPGAVTLARVEAVRESWGVEPGQRIVLLPGPMVEGRGAKVAIEAAARLQPQHEGDMVLVLAGDARGRAGLAAELDGLIAARGLGALVRRVGACADMPAALMAAHLVLVPSTRADASGSGAVEAQAMGKPVVVSTLGTLRETILAPPEVAPEQRTGWSVPPGNPAALASAIEAVLALGASALDVLSAHARDHVERRFALDRMTEAMLDAYSAVLEGHTHPEVGRAA